MSEQSSAVARPGIACQCSGDPYDMGFAQGLAVRPKAAGCGAVLSSLEAFRLRKPSFVPYPLFLRLAESRATSGLVAALRESNPAMLARLKGVAAGASVPVRRLCLWNAMEAFLSASRELTIAAPLGGCSALAVRGALARGGAPILARNFDYLPVVQPYLILRESRPRGGIRSLEFTTALHPGTLDGINEKGLAITQNYAFVTDVQRPAPLISMLIADTLARCGCVTEAIACIASRPRWGAAILTLADAAGDIAIMELSNTRAAAKRPAQDKHWLLATNVCTCPELVAVQVPENYIYSDRAPRALRGRRVLAWHAARACRIQRLLESKSVVGAAEIAAIMADHGPENLASGETPCVHTQYWRTCAVLQFFPATRSVRVSCGSACAADYVEFAL